MGDTNALLPPPKYVPPFRLEFIAYPSVFGMPPSVNVYQHEILRGGTVISSTVGTFDELRRELRSPSETSIPGIFGLIEIAKNRALRDLPTDRFESRRSYLTVVH